MASGTIIVSGATGNLGARVVERLCATGRVVVGIARRSENLEDLRRRCEGLPGRCVGLAADLRLDAEIDRCVTTALEATGRIDGLVNVIGRFHRAPLDRMSGSTMRELLEVNTLAPILLAAAVMPAMRAQGSGTIINVSSAAARLSLPGLGAYAGAKRALDAMTDALRREAEPHVIRIVGIRAGPFRSRDGMRVRPRALGRAGIERDAVTWLFDRLKLDPDRLARQILACLEAPNPRAWYSASAQMAMFDMIAALPARMTDSLVRRLWPH